MDILVFSALFATLGFGGGLIVGRWAHKQDRIARLRRDAMTTAGGKDHQAGKLINVLKS